MAVTMTSHSSFRTSSQVLSLVSPEVQLPSLNYCQRGWVRLNFRGLHTLSDGLLCLMQSWKPIGWPLPSCDDASDSQMEDICSFSCVRGAALS